MSFDLEVSYERLPPDLAGIWERGFRGHGFQVEVMPGFDPARHEGGFLPFRVTAAPAALVGFVLPDPAVSGFEVGFDDGIADFRSAAGRPSTEFAMQCLGAALLAEATGGTYDDPQSGETYVPQPSRQRSRRYASSSPQLGRESSRTTPSPVGPSSEWSRAIPSLPLCGPRPPGESGRPPARWTQHPWGREIDPLALVATSIRQPRVPKADAEPGAILAP